MYPGVQGMQGGASPLQKERRGGRWAQGSDPHPYGWTKGSWPRGARQDTPQSLFTFLSMPLEGD